MVIETEDGEETIAWRDVKRVIIAKRSGRRSEPSEPPRPRAPVIEATTDTWVTRPRDFHIDLHLVGNWAFASYRRPGGHTLSVGGGGGGTGLYGSFWFGSTPEPKTGTGFFALELGSGADTTYFYYSDHATRRSGGEGAKLSVELPFFAGIRGGSGSFADDGWHGLISGLAWSPTWFYNGVLGSQDVYLLAGMVTLAAGHFNKTGIKQSRFEFFLRMAYGSGLAPHYGAAGFGANW